MTETQKQCRLEVAAELQQCRTEAEYCDVHVCVCLSVSTLISGTARPKFAKFGFWLWFVTAIYCVLPVLWMASRLHDDALDYSGRKQTTLTGSVVYTQSNPPGAAQVRSGV